MGNDNSESQSYTSMRVDSETARKLKALSGMNDKSIVRILEELVDKAFSERIAEVASNPDKF